MSNFNYLKQYERDETEVLGQLSQVGQAFFKQANTSFADAKNPKLLQYFFHRLVFLIEEGRNIDFQQLAEDDITELFPDLSKTSPMRRPKIIKQEYDQINRDYKNFKMAYQSEG